MRSRLEDIVAPLPPDRKVPLGPLPGSCRIAACAAATFAALRHTGYRAYFVTTALATMADNIEHVISY
jgi:hypothetical protein